MPRETLIAPLILPLACTSDGSRTSTISTLPRSVRARTSAGGTRRTAELASASISLMLDGMAWILPATRMPDRSAEAVGPSDVLCTHARSEITLPRPEVGLPIWVALAVAPNDVAHVLHQNEGG